MKAIYNTTTHQNALKFWRSSTVPNKHPNILILKFWKFQNSEGTALRSKWVYEPVREPQNRVTHCSIKYELLT